jgi:hypothetical protein
LFLDGVVGDFFEQHVVLLNSNRGLTPMKPGSDPNPYSSI